MIRHNQFPRLLRSCSTRRIIVLLILLSILASGYTPAWAQSTPDLRVLGFEQHDLDGDGTPDLAIIECSCVTSLDQILVFDGGDDMQFALEWSRGTDFANDTWVYDIRADGNANLIIRFEQSSEHQIASLYDDRNGDSVVAYHVDQGQVLIDESPNWTMQVISTPSWVDAQGNPNLNLRVLQDTTVGSAFLTPELSALFMAHDGEPDWISEMTDIDHDGSPEFMWWRLLVDIPESYGVGRSFIYSNVGRTQSVRPLTAPFWLFLDFRPPLEREARYFDRIPTVGVNWDASQLTGFWLPGYPTEQGYHIQSLQYLEPDRINDPDHEMPHAYYDLAENQDGYPDLNIRLLRQYRPPGTDSDWKEIRYSWNQFHPGTLVWDYKLGMMGDPPIDDVVELGGFLVRMVPYENLPYWVTEQPWKLTTFVANEGGNRESSEGLYAWTPWHGVDPVSASNPSRETFLASLAYLTGASERSSQDFFNTIWEGYRGEYNLTRPILPRLYISPVDHRLHLKEAELGLMNLGDNRALSYRDLDGDGYFDRWELTENAELVAHLTAVPDHLVYGHSNEVLVKRLESPLASPNEILPPRNHDEWGDLGGKLMADQTEFAADDFNSMFAQFSGQEMQISGATVRDYRRTSVEGFRMVLDVAPGYRIQGDDLLGLTDLNPGQYVVSYDSGIFAIEILTPPDLILHIGTIEDVNAREPQKLMVQLLNRGLQDSRNLTLVVTAQHFNEIDEIASLAVDALAQETARLALSWQPPTSGEWTLTYRLEMGDGQVLVETRQPLTVPNQQATDLLGDLWLSSSPGWRLPAAVLLALLACCSGGAVYLRWQRHTTEGRV